jgi:hypothetical protein
LKINILQELSMFKKGDVLRVVRPFIVRDQLPVGFITKAEDDSRDNLVPVRLVCGEVERILNNRFVLHVPEAVAAPERDYAITPLMLQEVTVGMKLVVIDIKAANGHGLNEVLRGMLGQEVTVASIGKNHISIKERGGGFYPKRFRPTDAVVQAGLAPEPIKVGDKVRVKEGMRGNGLRRGLIVTVKSITVNVVGNQVFRLEEIVGGFKASRFEPVGKPAQAPVKAPEAVVEAPWVPAVGELVLFARKCTRVGYDDYNQHVGGVYPIVETEHRAHKDIVCLDFKGRRYWVTKDCLDRILAAIIPPEPKAPWVPKVGDKVFIMARVEKAEGRRCGWDNHRLGQGRMDLLLNNGKSYPITQIAAGYDGQALRVNCEGHGWTFLVECLTLDEGHGSPLPKVEAPKAPPKPVPPKEDIRQVLKKAMIDQNAGERICSYLYRTVNGEEKMACDAICYAQVRNHSPIVEFATSLINHKKHLTVDEMVIFKKWVEYLITISPWAKCYNPTTVEDALENGISFNTDLPHSQLVGAAIALREGHEYSRRLYTFDHMLEQGYNGNVAYMISMNVSINKDLKVTQVRCSDNHTALTDKAPDDEIISFFTKGFPDLKQKPCKEKSDAFKIYNTATPSSDSYGQETDDSFYKTVHRALKSKKTGKGFDEQIVTDIQSVYAYADTLQELF